MANQVTLTFAGETKALEESFGRAGSAAKGMGDKVGESAEGFHRAGEAADNVDTKAMGFRDTITGVQDSMTGLQNIMSGKGSLADGLFQLGAGVGDLGSGFYNFVIPALQKTKVATIATTVAGKAAAAASKIWAAAQWLLNLALSANPIGLIIIGIIALVAIIVLIATKTTWFQTAWKVAWGAIKSVAQGAWDFIKKIPGWIGSAFKTVGDAISGPFKAAFNYIADAWNNGPGRLSFSIPSWVPVIGGDGFSMPQLPHFHAGGVVPGVVGSSVLAMVQAGERIGSVASGGGEQVISISIGGQRIGDVLLDPIRNAVRTRGGNVQAVLGRG